MFGNLKNKKKQELAIIIGCGRLGANIADMFAVQGKDVVIIDSEESSFRKLSSDYSGFKIEANATDFEALKLAGIEKAVLVVAVTDNDNVNIMVSQIAKVIFNVPKVIMRIYDTDKEQINDGYSIDTIYPVKLSLEAFELLLKSNGQEYNNL
jgi:trk system potassium uptake protein TrkA